MKDLAVKKESLNVEVLLTTGETLSGKIFVSPVAERHEGRESILDMANNMEIFFVLITGNGVYIIHKLALLEIIADTKTEPAEIYFPASVDAKREKVEVHFINGKSEEGYLALLLDPYKSRLLDFMNIEDNFFVIKEGDKICIINKRQVEYVKPVKGE